LKPAYEERAGGRSGERGRRAGGGGRGESSSTRPRPDLPQGVCARRTRLRKRGERKTERGCPKKVRERGSSDVE